MKTFRRLSKLTAWIIPSKRYRSLYKDFLSSIDLKNDINKTQKNYKNVIFKLRDKIKTEKIKVIFLIRENQKWTYQSLYELLEKSDIFEPLVLVSLLDIVRRGKDKTRNHIEEDYNFFKSKGINVDYAYKDGKYIDLKKFTPDIVFYDQPWELPKTHSPVYVSQFALTFYSSYSYELVDCPDDYTATFHRFMFKFFVEHKLNMQRYASYNSENIKNCAVVGYPKLDEYFKEKQECNLWKEQNKLKVIYAPHHSVDKNGLKLSTFTENGKFILELAKKHPETTWIFKPHPRLKYALLRNKIMSESEIEEYFNEWAKIGTVYEKGSYIDLFRTSDIMITDGCSFLGEYLPSGKPLIRLINKNSIKLNDLGKMIVEGYYSSNNNSQIEELFSDLLINKNDYKKEHRKELISEILNNKSCKEIYESIINSIGEQI